MPWREPLLLTGGCVRVPSPVTTDPDQYEYTIELLIKLLRDVENEPAFPAEGDVRRMQVDRMETQDDRLKRIAKVKHLVAKALDRQADIETFRRNEAKLLLEKAVRARFLNEEDKASMRYKVDLACMQAHALLNEDSESNFRFSVWEVVGAGLEFAKKCKQCHCILFTFSVPWKFYYNSVRLRVSFFGFITCVLVFAFQAGILIETFMAVFTPIANFTTGFFSQQNWYFILLPLMLCLSAFLLEGLLELSMDAAQAVPLVNFQAAFLQGIKFVTWPRFFIWLLWYTSTAKFMANLYVSPIPEASSTCTASPIPSAFLTFFLLFVVCLVPLCLLRFFLPLQVEHAVAELKAAFLSHETRPDIIRSIAGIIYCGMVIVLPSWLCDNGLLLTCGYAAALTLVQKNPEDPKYDFPVMWERRIVDVTGFLLLEFFPLANGISGAIRFANASDGRGMFGAFIRSLFWGAVFCILIATWILQTSVACISATSSKIWQTRTFCGDNDSNRHTIISAESREYYKRWSILFRRKGVAPGMLTHMHDKLFQLDDEAPDLGLKTVGVAEYEYQVQSRWARTTLLSNLEALITAFLFGYVIWLVQEWSRIREVQVTQLGIVICMFLLSSVMMAVSRFSHTIQHYLQKNIRRWVGLFVSWIIWLAASGISYWMGSSATSNRAYILCPAFLITAQATSHYFASVFPGSVGRIYWLMSSAFYVLFAVLLVSPVVQMEPFGAQVTVTQTVADAPYWQHYVNVTRDMAFQHKLCGDRFGSEGAQLTALDLAQLAGLTYEKEKDLMNGNLSLIFNNTHRSATIPHNGWTKYERLPRYIVIDVSGDGGGGVTRIIALKGTSTLQDIQTDVMLFSAIKVLQLIEYVLPVISLFEVDQMQWFLYMAHLPAQRRAETAFFQKLTDEIRPHVSNAVGPVVLTGHSLGGAFAQIIAARLNQPAIVFSSPGVLYSADRFGIYQRYYRWTGKGKRHDQTFNYGVQVLKSRVQNVIPEYDIVPRVDKQLCLIAPIECRKKDGSFGTPSMCHSIVKTSCELWRVCGDPYGRSHNCSKFFKSSDINHWNEPDDFK